MYKEIFKDIEYPNLLDTFETLGLTEMPPWNLINDKYDLWKKGFNDAYLSDYAPFARMINDDVIATFNTKTKSVIGFISLNY